MRGEKWGERAKPASLLDLNFRKSNGKFSTIEPISYKRIRVKTTLNLFTLNRRSLWVVTFWLEENVGRSWMSVIEVNRAKYKCCDEMNKVAEAARINLRTKWNFRLFAIVYKWKRYLNEL
jgi:hypothetical protein